MKYVRNTSNYNVVKAVSSDILYDYISTREWAEITSQDYLNALQSKLSTSKRKIKPKKVIESDEER